MSLETLYLARFIFIGGLILLVLIFAFYNVFGNKSKK